MRAERPALPSRITIPPRAHPLVRFIFAEMQRQGITYVEMAERSGLSRESLTAWRVRNVPDVTSVEAALGVLGYRLVDFIEVGTRAGSAEREMVAARIEDAQRRAREPQHMTRESMLRSLQMSLDMGEALLPPMQGCPRA